MISKLDAKRVRKRNFIILLVIAVITVGGVGILFYFSEQPNELTISENQLVVSGMYGLEWPMEEISTVELVQEIPAIQVRTNGISYGNRAKGRYRLEELGSGTLFIFRDNPPYLFVEERGDDFFFINSEDPVETHKWYEEVKKAVQP